MVFPLSVHPNVLIAGQTRIDAGPPRPNADFEIIKLNPSSPSYSTDVAKYVRPALQNVVEYGERNGFDVAAALAKFYLNNRNPKATFTVSGRWLFSLPAARQGMETNLARFATQVSGIAAGLKPGQSVRLQDHWDAQILSSSYKDSQGSRMVPHYPALGSFTVQSHADLTISKDMQGRVSIKGGVKSGLVARYDWNNPATLTDLNSKTRVELTQRDFEKFEELGMAAPFHVRSKAVTSVPTISGGRVQWRSVDETGKSLPGPTQPRGGRSPATGGFSG